MRTLHRVDRFAARAHAERWCLGWMARELGASVHEIRFGRGILGLILVEGAVRTIHINGCYADSPLRQAILAHELAHVLLGHRACLASEWSYYDCPEAKRIESLAWRGAARLAVSRAQLAALDARALRLHDVAEQSGVPPGLVHLAATGDLDRWRVCLRQMA